MNRHLSYFFVVLASCLSFALIISAHRAPLASSINLQDALKNQQVNAFATSNGKHSGRSVDLVLVNKTSQVLQLTIPAGTQYEPEDEGEQTLIQLEPQLITLQPGGTFRGQVGAFCTEAGDRCPSSSGQFKISQNKNPKFDALTAYLKDKKVNKLSYQDAVWAISDGFSVSNMVAETQADKDFRKQVAQISGQKDTWYTSPQQIDIDDQGNFNFETLNINGRLSFNCAAGTKVFQDIHKGNGDVFHASDRSMTAQYGNVNYAFHLAVRGWEKGKYYIRVHDGTKELGRYEFTI